MKPTVGRIVYFKSEFSDEERAAIITRVEDSEKEIVSLSVFHPDIIEFKRHVEHGEGTNQWDWMPYQKGQAKKTEEVINAFNAAANSARICGSYK
jgi:hypothetical protein